MTSIVPTGMVSVATSELIKAAIALEEQAAALRAIAEGDARHSEPTTATEKRNPPAVLHKGRPPGPLAEASPTGHLLHTARRNTNSPGGYL